METKYTFENGRKKAPFLYVRPLPEFFITLNIAVQ